MLSPLKIDEYFLEQIEVTINPDYKKDQSKNDDIALAVEIMRNESQPLSFLVNMKITINEKNKDISFKKGHIHIELTGFFSFAKELDEETMKKMISISGPSILFGIARGIVGQVTANCKYGKFILPSVNIIEIMNQKAEVKKKMKKKKIANT